MSANRILFVEDEAGIYEPFSQALSRNGFEPLVARSCREAREMAARVDADLVLLDLGLPDGDGRDLARELRRESDVPIIILTARGTETDKVVGLELGADDYVVKPFSSREVVSRIRAVLRRAKQAPGPTEPIVEVGDLVLGRAARKVTLRGEPVALARREFDLLAELVAHAGEVVTREELMDRVWDVNWFGSTKTLDVHIRALRKKLGDTPETPGMIETVRGVGFRFGAPEDQP